MSLLFPPFRLIKTITKLVLSGFYKTNNCSPLAKHIPIATVMNRPSEDISQTYLILSDGPKVDSRSVRAGVCVDSTVGVAQSESLF